MGEWIGWLVGWFGCILSIFSSHYPGTSKKGGGGGLLDPDPIDRRFAYDHPVPFYLRLLSLFISLPCLLLGGESFVSLYGFPFFIIIMSNGGYACLRWAHFLRRRLVVCCLVVMFCQTTRFYRASVSQRQSGLVCPSLAHSLPCDDDACTTQGRDGLNMQCCFCASSNKHTIMTSYDVNQLEPTAKERTTRVRFS